MPKKIPKGETILSDIKKLMRSQVSVQISGKDSINGLLTDVGKNILVLFNGERYLYIPLVSIHRIEPNFNKDEQVTQPNEASFVTNLEDISYHDVLTNALGMFVEISVTRHIPFHGYITSVNNDYFTFYSPVYKQMYISLLHLKWLALHNQSIAPYTLIIENPPALQLGIPLQKSFEEQLKQVIGRLVVLDGGSDPMKIGVLKGVEKNMVELTIANGGNLLLNLSHVKSVHLA